MERSSSRPALSTSAASARRRPSMPCSPRKPNSLVPTLGVILERTVMKHRTRRRTLYLPAQVVISIALFHAVAGAKEPGEATESTKAAHAKVREQLPFDKAADFED